MINILIGFGIIIILILSSICFYKRLQKISEQHESLARKLKMIIISPREVINL